MKPWGIVTVLSAGFVMGLAVTGAGRGSGAVMAETLLKDTGRVEDYWNKTEIQLADLERYVNNEACQKNSKQFLACVNSVLFALQKTDYHLRYDGLIAENKRREHRLDNYNEKQNLAPFINLFEEGLAPHFNFKSLWTTVLSLNSELSYRYVVALGINGYLSVSVDPHTYISPTNFFKDVSSSSERSKFFLGLSFEKRVGRIFLRKVFKNSDAEIAGLRVNDEIISLNGVSVGNLNLVDVSALLKDKNQKSIPVIVKRGEASYVKRIVRSYRALNQVQAEVLTNGPKIGYVQLSKFAYDTCDTVKAEILKMKPMSLHGLILDLRDNPGGLLSEASCLAGLFIGADQKIFSVKYLANDQGEVEDEEVALTTEDKIYGGPLVILTNNSSASASELIAGALQEYKRATIIGERTFGKGSFQEIEMWNERAEISLFRTRGFYLLPSGSTTQLTGVQPDIEMNDDNMPLNENDMYQNPLSFTASFSSRVLHQIMRAGPDESSLGFAAAANPVTAKVCGSAGAGNVRPSLSGDKFIASAQRHLDCEFTLSAQMEDRHDRNINL